MKQTISTSELETLLTKLRQVGYTIDTLAGTAHLDDTFVMRWQPIGWGTHLITGDGIEVLRAKQAVYADYAN